MLLGVFQSNGNESRKIFIFAALAFISVIFRYEILYGKYVDLLDKLKEVKKSQFFSTVCKLPSYCLISPRLHTMLNTTIVCLHAISCVNKKCVENLKCVWHLPEKKNYQNSEYQFGPKIAENQNFSFLAFEGEAARGVTQIYVQWHMTFFAQIMFLPMKSPKT
jgi:hypothetical protein